MKRTRKVLMLGAAMGLVASTGIWVGLKIGRPVYYSDGNAEVTAADLRNSGMVRWSVPQPEFDIPGPVRGRVTELPDGRLIYGRVFGPNVTNLVLFDPQHPSDPAQPVIELNSPGHDLSPVLGPSGRLYFASDRPTGPGGFDIYAATYRDGLFFAPRPLPEGINTGLDESDPTVDSGGGQIVFVRRDPEEDGGRNGKLMTASMAAPDGASPVFPDEDASKYRRELPPPVDRDPMLAPDGVGLYFVRRTPDGATALMRTSWHVDHYVQPMAVEALQNGGPFRGPTLVDDGFGMRLVSGRVNAREDGSETVTIFRADGREVYPFWEGQWWLEWLLLYLVLFFAVILILLTLGARWSSLDFITKLVLLSVLIHLLLLLLFSGVEIVRSFKPRGPDTGAVQVHLVSQRAAQGDSGTMESPKQNLANVSEALTFAGHEKSLEVNGPAVDVTKTERALESAKSEGRPTFTPNRRAENAKVEDPAAAVALRAASTPERAPDRKMMKTEAEAKNRTIANRRTVAAETIKVVVPGADSAIVASKPSAERSVAAAAPRRVLPSARDTAARASVADSPVRPRRRANAAEAAGAAASLRAAAAERVAMNRSARPQPVREPGTEVGMRKATPAKGALAAAPKRRAMPEAGEAPRLRPREIAARARSVIDAPDTRAKSGAAAPAEATLAKSVGTALNQTERRVDVARVDRAATRSGVAVPRSSLAGPSREARSVEVAPRELHRPTDPTRGSRVALTDAVDPIAAERLRHTGAEALSQIDAKSLEDVRPEERRDTEVARGERSGVEPATRELATPGSLLARDTRRGRTTGGPEPRQLEAGDPLSRPIAGMVALRDDASTTSSAPTVETGETGETELAAADLRKFASPGASTAPRAERGASGVVTESRDVLSPGSLVEVDSRRVVAAAERIAERRPSRTRDLLADAVALRDDAVVGESTPAPNRSDSAAGTSNRPARSRLAELEQTQKGGLGRPSREHYRGGGLHEVSIGIVPPGSFLTRAGVRPEVPVVVAKAEELTPYSNRFGEKKLAALKKYGGTEQTERAVRRGLAYLASIQNEDGTWGDPRASQRKYGQVFIGKTGLCLLAFLGAGHTPQSDTKYSEVSRRAIDALLETQRESAHFGVTTAYSHGITTYALAECYAMTKSERLRKPLERAIRWILANQNRSRDRRNRGGWGYFSSTLRPEDSYSRSSTTAWQVMALESAKLSGIEIPDDALDAARDYLLNNYDRRYRYFLYNKEPSRLRSEWRTLPASTPAAVFCLQLLGMESDERRLEAGLNYTLDRAPKAYRRYSDDEFVLRGAGNVYFWYYSTLACFMAGGDTWEEWNRALKKVLLSGQDRDGSFPLIDSYARYAGDTNRDRSYTTAMCVLSLEVYYRYFTPLLKRGK